MGKLPKLSDEQENFIQEALKGRDVLVDACIGSGKTTAIQSLCERYPEGTKILYLTYNKLLKLDAKSKIHVQQALVTNYHGFAYMRLIRANIKPGISDLIQTYNKTSIDAGRYDVLILDEYQDIEQELAEMLESIKNQNPGIQIVAVGDMHQKIYDKTTLNVPEFISQYLCNPVRLEFTKCFRLGAGLASKIGDAWGMKIEGVNKEHKVEFMTQGEIVRLLSGHDPSEILCLGATKGCMAETLNILEDRFPQKYNKNTVYAKIREDDGANGGVSPSPENAIFTTYDGSKGLERDICVVFDFTHSYWFQRLHQPGVDSSILRNIFLVAASRGKKLTIFAKQKDDALTFDMIKKAKNSDIGLKDVAISEMFDFKFKEQVEKCYSLLKTELVDPISTEINAMDHDGLIDLSPCIGVHQEAMYFKNYDIDKDIAEFFAVNPDKTFMKQYYDEAGNISEKILFLTMLSTGQNRYLEQADRNYMSEDAELSLRKRLSQHLSEDEDVQVQCMIPFAKCSGMKTVMEARGFADAVKDGIVWELKFVTALKHEHYLQCACYMVGLGLEEGRLWNTRTGELWKITIPDRKAFLDAVAIACTRGMLAEYCQPSDRQPLPGIGKALAPVAAPASKRRKKPMENIQKQTPSISKPITGAGPSVKVAIIDTETTWKDEVMSIGVIVSDLTSEGLRMGRGEWKAIYYVIDPAYRKGGMFSDRLFLNGLKPATCSLNAAVTGIKAALEKEGVQAIFAYNAGFDKRQLPALGTFAWYDVIKVAAYRQHNPAIDEAGIPCSASGRMKNGYGLEQMMRLMGCADYKETHNAYMDARDLACLMKRLGRGMEAYKGVAEI